MALFLCTPTLGGPPYPCMWTVLVELWERAECLLRISRLGGWVRMWCGAFLKDPMEENTYLLSAAHLGGSQPNHAVTAVNFWEKDLQ